MEASQLRSVLDAWAVIALVRAEAAGPRVDDDIASGQAGMSWINLGEVYYAIARAEGEARASSIVESLRSRLTIEVPDADMVLSAARIKAAHRVSYADAFALATAERHRASLLTGDPEILALERPLEMVDLRR